MLDMAEKERASVISEVKGFLRLYRDPVIAANTAVSDFRIDDLVNHRRPLSLYIAVTVADQDRMRPLMRLVLAQILNRLTERLEYRDGRAVAGYRHRLLLMIDEFPTLGRLDMFAKSLSLIAGYGIKACLIAQDITQIRGAYGHDETITSNCDTRVAFRPNGIETARLLSQMTGETTVRHVHQTISSSGASVSEPEFARPLLTPDEAMHLRSPRRVDLCLRTAGDSRGQAPVLPRAAFQATHEDSSAFGKRSCRELNYRREGRERSDGIVRILSRSRRTRKVSPRIDQHRKPTLSERRPNRSRLRSSRF